MRRSSQHLFSIPSGAGAIYQRIYKQMRLMILEGTWPPGARVPSSRALAKDLRISRNTALQALEQLTADGWIMARRGSGLFVSPEVERLATPPLREALRYGDIASSSKKPVCFEVSQQDVDLFPLHHWQRLQREIWSSVGPEALLQGEIAGTPALRAALARLVAVSRGIRCSADQIVVLPSAQAGLDLCARILTEPGDRVWVEDPGYYKARDAFAFNGIDPVAVPVDRSGIRVRDGLSAAPEARAAYVTPAAQFPTGFPLDPQRAAELAEWAANAGAWIIEDDWDWHAAFDAGHVRPALFGNDRHGRVIYLQSLSRTIFPALRAAFLVVPDGLVDRFVKSRDDTDGFMNVPNQLVLAEFLDRGYYSSHLRESQAIYVERRRVLADTLARELPAGFAVASGRNGLHLVVSCPPEVDDRHCARRLRDHGLACMAIGEFSVLPRHESGLMLGFAAFAADELATEGQRLARLLIDFVSGG